MTLEDIKKHARPLVWENDELISRTCLPDKEGVYSFIFVYQWDDGKYYNTLEDEAYDTKKEAMQYVEEYHLRELAKFFDLDEQ